MPPYLAKAIVQAAWRDAVKPRASKIRQEAREWFLAASGPDADYRNALYAIIGCDAARMFSSAIASFGSET